MVAIVILILIISAVSGFGIISQPEASTLNMIFVLFLISILISAWPKFETIELSVKSRLFVLIFLLIVVPILSVFLLSHAKAEHQTKMILLMAFEFYVTMIPALAQ